MEGIKDLRSIQIINKKLLAAACCALLCCFSCREMKNYSKDARSINSNGLKESDFGKKYYHFYDRSSLLNADTSLFLNEVFVNRRTNTSLKREEIAGICFFMNNEGKLVFIKSGYYAGLDELMSYMSNKEKWSGYAILENGLVKTEYLYNYNYKLTHQIIEYKYGQSVLTRIRMYREGGEGSVLEDKLVYELLKK